MHLRKWLTAMQIGETFIEGQRGFFAPRWPAPLPASEVDPLEASYYDTTPLKATLERLCDFDRINDGGIRVSVGAVNVRTGNLECFDNTERRLRAEHFMASGALPPGFPPVLIDGEYYWDGGVVSNTPLSYVLESTPRRDTLVFQVDLWSAVGPVPDTMIGVASRRKDLQYFPAAPGWSPTGWSARNRHGGWCSPCSTTCRPRNSATRRGTGTRRSWPATSTSTSST